MRQLGICHGLLATDLSVTKTMIELQDLESWLAPIAAVMCVGGVLLVTGVMRRWKWLVDPPASYWPMWGLSFIRVILGPRGLITALYLVSSGLVLVGLLTLVGIVFGKPA